MRLADFVSGIRQTSTMTTLGSSPKVDLDEHGLTFGSREFDSWIFDDMLHRFREPNVDRVIPSEIVRGAIVSFMARDTLYGTHTLFIGAYGKFDLLFGGDSKPDPKLILCNPVLSTKVISRNLADVILMSVNAPALKSLLRPHSISNLIFEAPTNTQDAIEVLPHLVSILTNNSTIVFYGGKTAVDRLLALTAQSGKLDIDARCEIHDFTDGDKERHVHFVALTLPDPFYLSGPPKPDFIVSSFSEKDLSASKMPKGPYEYVENDRVPDLASSVETQVDYIRDVVVRSPMFLDGPDGSDKTWIAQFGISPLDWMDPKSLPCPKLQTFKFQNASVVGTGPVFLESGHVVECSLHPMTAEQFRWWSVVHNSDTTFDDDGLGWSARVAGKSYVVEEPCLLIADPGLPMHYHFLFDFLPRLIFRKGPFADVSVAVPDIIKNYQYQALINVYGIPREKIVVYPTRNYATLFKQLIVTPTLVSDFWAAPEVVTIPRAGLSKARSPADARLQRPDFIYVSRRDTLDRRRLANEDKLVDRLSQLGFIEIYPGDYSLEEEMWIFSRAKIVIGPFGSGMANILFCSPGAKVIVLQPNSTNWRILSFVMDFLSLDYGYIFGEAFLRSGLGHNTEWVVDIDKVVGRASHLQRQLLLQPEEIQ